MLNWFPEAEHGGFYAAQVHGIFEQHGLQVELRPGGPSAPVAQELVAGRVQFAIGNADDVLVFREQDVPVVALMAPIQDTPRCIMVHESAQVGSLQELGGLTLQAGAGRPYLKFMEHQGLLKDVQVVPYSGVPKFASDTSSAMQAYSFSEPLLARQQGASVSMLMLSDVGFNPYASCLITTDDYVQEHRDIVGRMVAACREGWQKYLETPAEANAAILLDNEHGMTEETLEFGVEVLGPLCLPNSMSSEQVGMMSEQRWETLVSQFADMDLIDADKVTADAVFTTEFLSAPAATN